MDREAQHQAGRSGGHQNRMFEIVHYRVVIDYFDLRTRCKMINRYCLVLSTLRRSFIEAFLCHVQCLTDCFRLLSPSPQWCKECFNRTVSKKMGVSPLERCFFALRQLIYDETICY